MYLGTNGKYKFFAEEVSRCPQAKLDRIGAACQRVEQEVWNAVENFSHYLTKQSALVYAKLDQEIVGFALFDLSIKNYTLVVAANECMVLKAHQGFGLPNLFMAILTSHIRKDNRYRNKKRPYSSITFLSSTVSFKLMAAFKRYGYLAQSSSFNADTEICQIAKDYIQKESWTPISSSNLFFIKSAFPNAAKLTASIIRPNFVPANFVSERGDAFLFVCRINNFSLLRVISWFTLWRYGFNFSKRLIPISRITRDQTIYIRD